MNSSPIPVTLIVLTLIKGVFKTLLNIYEAVFCENSKSLKAINYFRKTFKDAG